MNSNEAMGLGQQGKGAVVPGTWERDTARHWKEEGFCREDYGVSGDPLEFKHFLREAYFRAGSGAGSRF